MPDLALPDRAPPNRASAVPRRPFATRALPYLLSLPALLVCIGILVPFVSAVLFSLQRYNLAIPYLRQYVWWGQYAELLSDPDFWTTVRVSAVYTVSTVGIELLLGLGIAMLLRERNWVNNAISVALLLPLMTAPAIAALMWKLMTNPGFGVLAWLASLAGVTGFKWASDPASSMFTVVLVDVWVYTPFMIVLLLAGLRSLPQQPFEAARLDGVPGAFVFFRITLPMLTPYILTATLFRLLDSIQQFDIVYAMTQGGPGESTMVFQVRAYLTFFQYTNVGRSAAMLMILWAITYVLSQVFIKQWQRLRREAQGHA